MTCMQLTLNNQRHYGVRDAEWVACHTAIGTMVDGACIGNGNNRTIRADFDIVCRTQWQMKQ